MINLLQNTHKMLGRCFKVFEKEYLLSVNYCTLLLQVIGGRQAIVLIPEKEGF